MSQEVTDFLSNAPEQIEQAAKAVGNGNNRKVFEAIYHHKSPVKSISEIVTRTGLTRKQVLNAGAYLDSKHVVRKTKKGSEVAYEKIKAFQGHKKAILRFASSPKLLKRLPTKRRPLVPAARTTIRVNVPRARTASITIDDVDAFSKVRKITVTTSLPQSVSEIQFKQGVQAVIGEQGVFKDWGGEKSDLFTTRLKIKGKRYSAAFAFKGPALKGKLILSKMGKNGDQLPRLFNEPADVYFVQHWTDIDAQVLKEMQNHAILRSYLSGSKVLYGIIDGADSHRLFLAYPKAFAKKTAKKRKSKT